MELLGSTCISLKKEGRHFQIYRLKNLPNRILIIISCIVFWAYFGYIAIKDNSTFLLVLFIGLATLCLHQAFMIYSAKRKTGNNPVIGEMTLIFYNNYFHVKMQMGTSNYEIDVPLFELKEIQRTHEMFTFTTGKNAGYFLLCDGSFDEDELERYLTERLPAKYKKIYKKS